MKPGFILIIFSVTLLTLRYNNYLYQINVTMEHFSATAVARSVHNLPTLERIVVSL